MYAVKPGDLSVGSNWKEIMNTNNQNEKKGKRMSLEERRAFAEADSQRVGLLNYGVLLGGAIFAASAKDLLSEGQLFDIGMGWSLVILIISFWYFLDGILSWKRSIRRMKGVGVRQIL